MADSAASIWRKYELDGVPSSGDHKPQKSKIIEWGAYLEELATLAYTSSLVYSTRAALYLNLVPAANTPALVVGDPQFNLNGLYMKNGGTGTGSWTRLGSVPGRQFIKVTESGGTANAVQFTSNLDIPTASYGALFYGTVEEANTGAVTFSINGETAIPVLTSSGNAMQAGYLPAGVAMAFVYDGANYRLLSDVASSAIQAAAEAAAAAAIAAVPTLQFDSIASLRLLTGSILAETAYVTGYYVGSRIGGGPFALDSSDSTTADNGGNVIVDADGRRWKRTNQTNVLDAHEWGCVDDGDWRGGLASPTGTDNLARIQAMIDAAPETIVEQDGYLSDAAGSWGALGDWATVAGAVLRFRRCTDDGHTGIFGLTGTLQRPVNKSLHFVSDSTPRGAALLSLNAIADWTKSNIIIDFNPSSAIYSTLTPPLATGNGNAIGIDGLALLRGGFRIIGNNGHSQEFKRFGIYGAPGNAIEVVDGSDLYLEDWLFPGTNGWSYTVIDNTSSSYRIQYTTGDAIGLEVEFVSTGTDFTYDSPLAITGGTFDQINIYQAAAGISGSLIGVATGSTANLEDFDSAGLQAAFSGAFYNGDGQPHEDWATADFSDYDAGVNDVHAKFEHFEIAHCYRGIMWMAGTYLLLRIRDFTIRAIADCPFTFDGFGAKVENGQLMGVIAANTPMLHLPGVRHAMAWITFDNINFGSEGGDTGTPYFNEPDANDDWWGGTPADSGGVGTDWKYHPAKTSVLIGKRDPLTGDAVVTSSIPSAAGAASLNFLNCVFGGTSSGTTDYAFEIAIGGVENITVERCSFANYDKGLFNESAVAAGHAPANNCLFGSSNVLDGSTIATIVPAGDAPLFSEGGIGWAIPGRSARSSQGGYGRRSKIEPMNAAVPVLSGSQWAKSGLTVTQNATDRDGLTEAWTVECTNDTTSTLTSNLSGSPGTVESGPAVLELWAKQGTGADKKVYWRAQHTGAVRYTQRWGFFIPDTVWRKFILPIPEVKPGTIPTWIIDLQEYAVGETLILGGDVNCWKGTEDPPPQIVFYSTTTNDFGSISAGASSSVLLTTGLTHIVAGDVVAFLNHDLDTRLVGRAACEAGGCRFTAYNHTSGSIDPASCTITVGVIPKKRYV